MLNNFSTKLVYGWAMFCCRDEQGDFLLEKIRDSAGQKGTGQPLPG
jgi:6-phosphogluconate dehydrogenase